MSLLKFKGNAFWKLMLGFLLGFHPVAISGASEYDFFGIYLGASKNFDFDFIYDMQISR